MIELSTKNKVCFGLGGLGKNLAFGLVSTYTLYYYNAVLNVSASFVGTLLMLARIFDAFNDPLMGVIVAKTKSKYGRYKPWIFSGAILNALIMIAMFSVPASLEGGKLKAYVGITYFLCGITYTLSDIPYWAVIPAITNPGKLRESLSSFARIFAGIGAGTPTVIVMACVYFLGGGHEIDNLRRGFSLLAIGFGIIYIITMLFTVTNIPSNELQPPTEKVSAKNLIKMLLKNDQALCIAVIIVLFNTAVYLTTNLVLYVFKYDVQREEAYTAFMAVSGFVQIASMFSYSLFRKKLTIRAIYLMTCILAFIAYVIFTIQGLFGNYTVAGALLPGAIISMANGLSYVMITILISGAVDYGEKKYGTRESSMLSSLQTLMSKLASAFAVFFAGFGIDLINLQINNAIQTPQTQFNLRMLFSIPSLICVTISGLIFFLRKDLGK